VRGASIALVLGGLLALTLTGCGDPRSLKQALAEDGQAWVGRRVLID
jgi:hypothetical protein